MLAARLHCTDQYISNEKINKKKDFHEKNIIIAWVAGLDIGNTTNKLLCSIQVYYMIDKKVQLNKRLIPMYMISDMHIDYFHNRL